jgi:hypothetical protein
MLDEVKKELDRLFAEGDISGAIGTAGGAFSICWENPVGAGVFQSEEAAAIADYLYAGVLDYICRKIKAGQQSVDAHSVKASLMYPSASAARSAADALSGGLPIPPVDPHSAASPRHDPEAEQRGSER